MKYIRTKDTLASVQREEDIELFKRVGQKVADTIEELCDELVFIYPRNYYDNHCEVWHLYHKCSLKEEIKIAEDAFRENTQEIIYGAIWTDKGLIYVAKMNEKGELELL